MLLLYSLHNLKYLYHAKTWKNKFSEIQKNTNKIFCSAWPWDELLGHVTSDLHHSVNIINGAKRLCVELEQWHCFGLGEFGLEVWFDRCGVPSFPSTELQLFTNKFYVDLNRIIPNLSQKNAWKRFEHKANDIFDTIVQQVGSNANTHSLFYNPKSK